LTLGRTLSCGVFVTHFESGSTGSSTWKDRIFPSVSASTLIALELAILNDFSMSSEQGCQSPPKSLSRSLMFLDVLYRR
jgi:hypothetical protein